MSRPDWRQLTLNLPRDRRPKYLRIADAIRRAIRSGQVRPGERIPSVRQLAELLRTNRLTVLAAAEELINEGWITSEYRKGYRVVDPMPSTFLESTVTAGEEVGPAKPYQFKLAGRINLDSFAPAQRVAHNFQSGLPDLRLFPLAEFRDFLRDAIRRTPREALLGYGDPQGYRPLLDLIGDYLRRVRGIQDRKLIITHGSQEAIYLVIRLLVRAGDTIAMEALSYPPARETIRLCGGKLIAVPIGTEGIDVGAFAKIVERRRIKLLYLTPLHQFPTTRTLSLASRKRLYEICARHGILILEDDYDHEYHYRCQPLAPIAATDPSGLVIYFSTFSKLLFPAARLGFVGLPERLREPFVQYRRLLSHENTMLIQSAVYRWMASGALERHIRKTRRLYEERRNALCEALETARQKGTVDYNVPDGGMAIWLNIHRDARALAERLLRQGVFVSAESSYRGDENPGTHLRLGFSNQNPQELRAGAHQLLRALDERANSPVTR
jgi:GntR family transcriptional regulator/MocR family aminotransferase